MTRSNCTPLLLLATALAPAAAWPASFCATNSTELQSALDTAETNGQNDIVLIATGSYTAPAGGFNYEPLFESGGDDFNIEISGGWNEFMGDPCGANLGNNGPGQTILSGNNAERILDIAVADNSDVEVRNLSFVQGNASGTGTGGGLRLSTSLFYSGIITLESNIFLANQAHEGGALSLGVNATSSTNVRILNSAFVGNTGRNNAGAAKLAVNAPDLLLRGLTQLPALSFTNNTVINNIDDTLTIGEANIGGVEIVSNLENKFVANNNFWNNTLSDIHIDDGSGFRLWSNNFETQSGAAPEFSSGNISVQPEYVSCGTLCLEYTPVSDSPLVDAGYSPLITLPWFLPDWDIRQGTFDRVNGDEVDIGAYENQSRLFSDRFEQ